VIDTPLGTSSNKKAGWGRTPPEGKREEKGEGVCRKSPHDKGGLLEQNSATPKSAQGRGTRIKQN